MFALSSVSLLGLALLAAPTDAAVQPPLPTCETGTRRIELTADAPGAPFPVCIHPGLSSSFLFNTKLASVELPGRERFLVLEGEAGFTLVPTKALETGERVPVTVSFRDGAAPASVTFELVVHPTQAERQVEVTRQPRAPASCWEGEQQVRAELQQSQEEKARVEAGSARTMGLTGLRAQGLMGEGGITSKSIKDDVPARPGNTLKLMRARSYRCDTERTEGGQKVVRLAVELELRNNGGTSWTPAGAVLVGPGNEAVKVLGVWLLKPIAPGDKGRVVVEVEATEDEARGTFTLKLWSQEDSARGELFDGVRFP